MSEGISIIGFFVYSIYISIYIFFFKFNFYLKLYLRSKKLENDMFGNLVLNYS